VKDLSNVKSSGYNLHETLETLDMPGAMRIEKLASWIFAAEKRKRRSINLMCATFHENDHRP